MVSGEPCRENSLISHDLIKSLIQNSLQFTKVKALKPIRETTDKQPSPIAC